jgi:hypothetical protein
VNLHGELLDERGGNMRVKEQLGEGDDIAEDVTEPLNQSQRVDKSLLSLTDEQNQAVVQETRCG